MSTEHQHVVTPKVDICELDLGGGSHIRRREGCAIRDSLYGVLDGRCQVGCVGQIIALLINVEDDGERVFALADRSHLGIFNVGDEFPGCRSEPCIGTEIAWEHGQGHDRQNHNDDHDLYHGEGAATIRSSSALHTGCIGSVRRTTECTQLGAGATRCRGIALVEALLAMTILSVAVLAVSYTMAAGQQHLYEGDAWLRATRLADHLQEEIGAKPYQGSGPERLEFHLSDYEGLTEQGGQLHTLAGEAYGESYQGYSRQVSVVDTTVNLADLGGVAVPGKTVIVSVTDSKGRTTELSRFIAETGSP